jgi:hypothetical protein
MFPRSLLTLAVASALAGPLTVLAFAKAAASCFGYAPDSVELIGALGRQSFSPEPLTDLFVDPNDLEVEGVPPPGMAGTAASAAAGDTPAQAVAAGTAQSTSIAPATPAPGALDPPAEIVGPPIPPELLAPDPVLLRARPVPKPPLPEAVWLLTLPKPICVRVEAGDLVNQPEKNVRQLQLIMDKELEPGLRPLLKKRVVVRGQLFHATSRRHYLPVLFNVEDLRPPEWVQDTTQRRRPPPQ